jgi:hypothetical protein
VRVKLAAGTKAVKVTLLVAEQVPHADESSGYLEVTVPSILDHEVVAIDLS